MGSYKGGMKSLVLYDSVYGNTEKVARAISKFLRAEIVNVADANPSKLHNYELIIVGSPVHGGRASPAMQEFIKKIPDNSLKGIKVTAFDTRISPEGKKFWLRLLMKMLGFAAERLANDLTKKGGILLIKPQGFIVKDKEGPLQEGELEKAVEWVKNIT